MRVFILSGEPSGDLHGAWLARALTAQAPDSELTGVGGTRMREAGVALWANSEHWGAMGIADALCKVPRLLIEFERLLRHLLANPPDVLVLIDFGAFNVRLLKRLRGHGIRTVYYIPPGCWSRRRPAGVLPFLVDAIATPFAWSAENLRAAEAPARITWVGHPILEYSRPTISRAEARLRLRLPDDRPVVAVVPGSRNSELRYVLPAFLGALDRLTPAPIGLLTVAPSLGEAAVGAAIARAGGAHLDIRLLNGLDYDLVQAADAALVTSGTATLELACLNLPMVVAYRVSPVSEIQLRFMMRFANFAHFSLPNILAQEGVLPELLQHGATPEALVDELTPLLTDSPARRAQLDLFARIRPLLGDGHAVEQTAELVLSVARNDAGNKSIMPPV